MALRSKLALGLAAGALVIGSVSPAAAHGYDRHWRGHRDGVDAGAVFGLLLGVGLIAAIASANSNKTKAPPPPRDHDPRADNGGNGGGYGGGYDDRGAQDQRGYDGRGGDDRRYDDGRAGYASEDEAVDACAVAAREEASRAGGFADIRRITGAQAHGNGWDVTGTIDQRTSYRATESRQRSFRCLYENGQVSGVSFSQGV
ncbi:hypothetical protein [Sphingobium nicotianae]|uniref:PepSY domain-containing protein n=1 Tax=Sphingobium nicotianae TaxID=2782607 RepID=A0A9X1DB69_9SPHN|nr:hypothetical protein [Sphingobium nicotianae]MBT2186729.1 hypothetical protein [Sphingobium nicotianae]